MEGDGGRRGGGKVRRKPQGRRKGDATMGVWVSRVSTGRPQSSFHDKKKMFRVVKKLSSTPLRLLLQAH